ncbi:MAG: glycosyltransferase [Alphaproteobacteria bacterium]|nr:glycosyltransferase [Alphaproteobacteria bacterium]
MSNGTLRILCLGYCFPPVASPESFVTAKTMAAIPDTNVDIVTASPYLFAQFPDHSMDAYVKSRFGRVERIDGTRYRLLGKISHFPMRPDRYLLLTGATVRAAEFLQPKNYDCLITRSQYHSIHAAGRKLKKRHPGLPWIACFSDPWSNSIYDRKLPLLSAWSDRLESLVLQEADALVFPTAEMQKSYVDQNPNVAVDEKSHVVPHGFDPSLYNQGPARDPGQTINIGMFGSFYGPRTPHLLFNAIDRMSEDSSLPDFMLQVYGGGGENFDNEMARYPAARKHIVHGGVLPHIDALARMETCDLLAISDAPMPPPSIFLSSKMIDYMGAYRPIFAITPEGVTQDLVQRTGGWVVDPDDPAAIAAKLSEAIREIKARKVRPSERVRNDYRIDRIGGRLRDLLDQTIAQMGQTL